MQCPPNAQSLIMSAMDSIVEALIMIEDEEDRETVKEMIAAGVQAIPIDINGQEKKSM